MDTIKCIDKNCLGCRFYTCVTQDLFYCSYMFQTDKRRPCPPGKDCTVKEKRTRKKIRSDNW